MLVTQDFAEEEFGPGDDVFMVGRFMDHAGKDRNHPALRCGNIAMNPTPIIQENGAKADAYCIDLHSPRVTRVRPSLFIGHRALIW